MQTEYIYIRINRKKIRSVEQKKKIEKQERKNKNIVKKVKIYK